MKLFKLIPSVAIAVSSIAALALITPSAQAYSVVPNGKTAGNPGGQSLNDIRLHSGDVGRVLDPTKFHLSAGSTNKDGRTLTQDLVGKAVITVMALTKDKLSLQINVSNETKQPPNPDYKMAIMSLWFGVEQPVSSIEIAQAGNPFSRVEQPTNGQQSTPGGFKDIDVCVLTAQNCSGGNVKKGLQIGQSDTFAVNIFGDFSMDSNHDTSDRAAATISDIGVKWKGNDGSYELAGTPEPVTILGSGLAAGFGIVMKRKSGKNQRNQKEKAIA
ncbi:MAG: cistern family PEP-CTERM protein [Leptolyngbya sp. SIO4C1]|nr:cistern family PEP-CTERM protein [Leptolyngbya sp. SIO4C1]